MTRVAIKTVGCKTNYADTDEIAFHLESLGLHVVPFGEEADVIIVNSCVVTQKAESDSRRALKKGLRMNQDGLTILTGCGVIMKDKGTIAESAKVIIPMNPGLIGEKISELIGQNMATDRGTGGRSIPYSYGDRARKFINIQNGCDYKCSYCIVPLARGKSVSRNHDEVLDEIVKWEGKGVPEVVLTGIHIGHYGRDLPGGRSISELVSLILRRTRRIRIRLSSLEIDEISESLLEMMVNDKRLCNHLHIPLQSGDDRILGKMRRWYTTEGFRGMIETVKNYSDEIGIGTDVITGFPGETERSFEQTLAFFTSLPVDYAHVFPYSQRIGTEAASWRDQVSDRVKQARTQELIASGEAKRRAFIDTFIGKTLEVVSEKTLPGIGFVQGTTDNYIKVIWEGENPDSPVLVPIEIEGRNGDRAIGTYRRKRG